MMNNQSIAGAIDRVAKGPSIDIDEKQNPFVLKGNWDQWSADWDQWAADWDQWSADWDQAP